MIKNKGLMPLNTEIFIIYFVAAFLCARNILSKPICRRPLKILLNFCDNRLFYTPAP